MREERDPPLLSPPAAGSKRAEEAEEVEEVDVVVMVVEIGQDGRRRLGARSRRVGAAAALLGALKRGDVPRIGAALVIVLRIVV